MWLKLGETLFAGVSGCMRNKFRRFMIVLAFVIFPVTGYMTVSNVTPCQAQSCPCGAGTSCIAGPSSLSDALVTIFNSIIQPALDDTRLIMTTYLTTLAQNFGDGMALLVGDANAKPPVQGWVIWQLSSWFDTFWYYNLLPMMQLVTAELSTANLEQSYALGAFSDAENAIRARRVLDDMQLEDHRALRPSDNVCTAATMMGGMERATGFSDGYNAAAAAGKLWRSANRSDMPSRGGFSMDVNSRWYGTPTSYTVTWCDASYNDGSTVAGSPNYGAAGCTASSPFAGQDVDVAGLIFGHDTINLTPPAACQADNGSPPFSCGSQVKTNLDELITNLAEPFVKDPVTADSKAGKTAILDSVSYKTKRQIVYDGLYYIASRRVPGSLPANLIKDLENIRGLTGEDESQAPFSLPNINPSRNEMLRAMMTQRFQSGIYSMGQIDEPENNRREMVIEQALQLIQMSDELDMMDHYALLLASQVSTEVKVNAGFSAASEGAPLK